MREVKLRYVPTVRIPCGVMLYVMWGGGVAEVGS